MRKIILFFLIISGIFSCRSLFAQCAYNNTLYTTVTPTCPGSTTVNCCWGGHRVSVNVIAGNTYTFATCGGSWDSQITLYNAAGTVVLGYNDDGCGLQSTVTWVATYTGVLQVLIDYYPCANLFTCINLLITCTAPGPPPVIASDCNNAVNVCTNLSFSIDPNGFGAINEIPLAGSAGNPSYTLGDAVNSPWGTDHWGCLMGGELNSTWMIINVQTTGNLEFVFGGGGTQTGYYDWIMYPYTSATCAAIPGGTIAPVRCNWNAVSNGGTGCVTTLPGGGNAGNYEPALAVTAGQQYVICFSNWSSSTTVVPLQFNGTSTVSCTPLPIELLSFTGDKQNEGINVLKWTTATETNNDYFLLKKSTDAVNWETIGTVQGAGTSSTQLHYQFLDLFPQNTINYYQLTQVDYNAQSVTYNMISINNSFQTTGILKITNMMGQTVDIDFEGLRIIYYADGRVIKKIGK